MHDQNARHRRLFRSIACHRAFKSHIAVFVFDDFRPDLGIEE
jgi:hypothetical protein